MALGRLAVLKKRMVEVKEATNNSRIAKRERQATNKRKKLPDFQLENQECGQTREKVLTYKQVQEWFREGITKRIRWSVTIPSNSKWWGGKQRHLARKLLDAYDGELVRKAIFYMCDNWEEMVKSSAGRLSGMPTIELLWSIRDRIFPDAERGVPYTPYANKAKAEGHPRRNADEYREPEDDAVGHGW